MFYALFETMVNCIFKNNIYRPVENTTTAHLEHEHALHTVVKV